MSIWFYISFFILICILIFIILKLVFIKKSIKEIKTQLTAILKSDTNNLITISSSDSEIKKLASCLNAELKELRSRRLQYENGNQELKKTITNISHDLRTPLTAISGYIELLKEKNNKEYIEVIERKTKDLVNLTDQLFYFSKTMDIGTKINKERCCINEILEETIANYYTILKEKNIVPQIKITNEKIYKYLDKNSIIRVFENILSNACKYSDGDFKIKLESNGKITFSNKANSLDAITVQKIFDRYFSVENAKKSTGIGLSIAKQLVELNDGIISVKYIENYLVIEIIFN